MKTPNPAARIALQLYTVRSAGGLAERLALARAAGAVACGFWLAAGTLYLRAAPVGGRFVCGAAAQAAARVH